ncbi:MAG TPA: bifunctional phosphoribosylaminoimidazolecarboxamide formyltransferase/IMP cyclohydrolase [Deltaproteobacteria bacterium]|nr:bifunctional phosphoribosylaminoimidazolecarboxamide formyltransferase/IMP cyclohydrolase [Deltaproteobacteria bacterium]HXK48553.1 bifunctional phosphoribosylaminoimidazolecarboxamide formyltransferase/IMP cyclohydrolase [Deltaproteobacteria bacterium]
MAKITRALVSVTDKKGVTDFVRELAAFGVEIISTGGTAKALKDAGIKVIDISEFTGFPEMMDGRLKTLHPLVHGGMLAIRDNKDHVEAMKKHGIRPIDMLIVNLYRFEETIARGASLEEAIENIDIGGPAMVRAASKNNRYVSVVTDPAQYPRIIEEMKATGGSVSEKTNFELARDAFSLTARYDAAISNYLQGIDVADGEFPLTYTVQYQRRQTMRYGENPHQKAAFYVEPVIDQPAIATADQLWGKELSYNNIMDADAALDLIMEFNRPACVILKHSNPCGAAQSDGSLAEAYRKALAVDTTSAFGGIVGLNRTVDADTARAIGEIFTEVVVAPDYTPEALAILEAKKNVRLLKVPGIAGGPAAKKPLMSSRRVTGGLLLQERDLGAVDLSKAQVVTKRGPTADELEALTFAWRIVKYVKSNAVIYATKDQLVGVGAGQMSRVDSSKLAIIKAGNAGLSTRGTVIASDAFFPFRDGVDEAARAGATAIVQPGGSVRDAEVIQAADEHDMAMIFTGMRHFRH